MERVLQLVSPLSRNSIAEGNWDFLPTQGNYKNTCFNIKTFFLVWCGYKELGEEGELGHAFGGLLETNIAENLSWFVMEAGCGATTQGENP